MKKFLSLALLAVLPLLPVHAQDSGITSRQVYAYAGAPSNGTSEVDTLTIQSGTSAGTFTITIDDGRTTAPITWSATDATLVARVDAALEVLSAIGTGGVTTAAGTLSSGIGTITITFTGKNARQNMPALSIGTNSLTGGSAPTLTTTTAGVAATWGTAPTGTLIEDTSNGDLFQNISTTAGSPNWQYRGTGWRSGSGGAVAQATDRTTGVTLNTRVGKVTTQATSLAAVTSVKFTVTNSSVAATDNIVLSKVSGDADTIVSVGAVAAGSFDVVLFNTHASGADVTATVINFEVRKGAID
jgi:hypothetical protein